jgi:hypothetical protein
MLPLKPTAKPEPVFAELAGFESSKPVEDNFGA